MLKPPPRRGELTALRIVFRGWRRLPSENQAWTGHSNNRRLTTQDYYGRPYREPAHRANPITGVLLDTVTRYAGIR